MHSPIELFKGLNDLCQSDEAFYFSEQDYAEDYVIRSYSYRLASWTQFEQPFAKECRGTAFILNKKTQDWTLFCRAYPKFFNLNEGIPKEEYMQDNVNNLKSLVNLILEDDIDHVLGLFEGDEETIKYINKMQDKISESLVDDLFDERINSKD